MSLCAQLATALVFDRGSAGGGAHMNTLSQLSWIPASVRTVTYCLPSFRNTLSVFVYSESLLLFKSLRLVRTRQIPT